MSVVVDILAGVVVVVVVVSGIAVAVVVPVGVGVVVVVVVGDAAFEVRVVKLELFDDGRERAVPVQFWRPRDVIFTTTHDVRLVWVSLRHASCSYDRPKEKKRKGFYYVLA